METSDEKKRELTEKRNGYFKNILLLIFLAFLSALAFASAILTTQTRFVSLPLVLVLLSVLIPGVPFFVVLRRTGGLSAAFGAGVTPFEKAKSGKRKEFFSVGARASDMVARFLLYFLTIFGGMILLAASLAWRTAALTCVQIRLICLKRTADD